MKYYTFWIIITLACVGISVIGLFLHEIIHVIQSTGPKSICYDFNQDSDAHVTANDFTPDTELWGYTIQYMFSSIGCLIIFIIAIKEMKK